MYRIENFDFFMKELNRNRTVRVYLPNDYDSNENKRYSVMYMHDGHNLFYKETSAYGGIWNAHEAMNNYEASGKDGIIIVGIDCNNGEEKREGRLDEYSPWVNEDLSTIIPSRNMPIAGGEGGLYVDFIVNTLKPYIDSNYKTLSDRANTFIAGSSMGGFISLYAAYKYNNVFSVVGAFSSAIWFKKDKLVEFIKDNFKLGTKIYLDIGTNETSDNNNREFNDIYVNDTKDIYNLLLSLGQPEKDILLIVDEGANHSEVSWERRFPEFLKWIK